MRSLELQMPRMLRTPMLVFAALAGGLAGCGTIAPVESAGPPITDPAQLYSALSLNQPALNLTTDAGDPAAHTFQLVATPRDALGNPMTGLPAPVFKSLDTTRVKVSADGLVTADSAGTNLKVIATLVSGPVTHADTALINVTNSVTPLASLSIHPAPPDSARWPVVAEATTLAGSTYLLLYAGYLSSFQGPTLAPVALDASDADITSQLQLEYSSLDPMIAQVGRRNGAITVVRPGDVRLVVRTNAYGTIKADTMTYTVTPPTGQDVMIQEAPTQTGHGPLVFFPSEIIIRTYGIVVWGTMQGDSVDVTFDDPSKATAAPSGICDVLNLFLSLLGNIFLTETPICGGTGNGVVPGLPLPDENGYPASAIIIRQFTQPGTYTYHSTRTGATGRIVVTDVP